MTKTPVSYKETLFGILPQTEIERHITEQLVAVQKYLFRHYEKLPLSSETARLMHQRLAGVLFTEAGSFRRHKVVLGNFSPPPHFQISEQMKNWEDDIAERGKYAVSLEQKFELCAWLIHRFLWIHPFFDYNGRISRLLGELYLLKNNLPITSFRSSKRITFVHAVQHATKTNDLTLLIKLISTAYKK